MKKECAQKSTATNARLINGYAKETSNFVITAIRNKLTTKAPANPEIINGSRNAFAKKSNFGINSPGIKSLSDRLHFKIN